MLHGTNLARNYFSRPGFFVPPRRRDVLLRYETAKIGVENGETGKEDLAEGRARSAQDYPQA
jgi:hypothetical protein